MSYNLDGYVDVPTRLAAFFHRYPGGSLQLDPPNFIEVDGKSFIWAQARAFRSVDDERPGIGTAWEQLPGQTPYTRGSELMVLETSAWGRAIAAVMVVGDKIATVEEVQAAEARRTPAAPKLPTPTAPYRTPSGKHKDGMAEPATEPQIKKLRYEMGKAKIDEVMLNDFTVDVFGWEMPVDGIDKLTKGQASALIDALTNQTFTTRQPIERTTTPDYDDPWQVKPA